MKYQVILQHNEEDCGAACKACDRAYIMGVFFHQSGLGSGRNRATRYYITQPLLLEPRSDFKTQSDDRNKVGSFNRFFQQFWNYRTLLAEALLLNLVLGLLSLASPFLLQILTDDVLIRGDIGRSELL